VVPRPKPKPSGGTRGEAPKPSEPTQPAAPTQKGSPRGEAERETKRAEVESDFVNDRESAVSQRGEDVLGSARHKAVAWKGLREALESSDANKLFTRTLLERENPLELIEQLQAGGEPGQLLFVHLASRKFPPKPPALVGKNKDELGSWFMSRRGGNSIRVSTIQRLKMREEYRAMDTEQKKALQVEYDREQREGYFKAHELTQDILRKHAAIQYGSVTDLRKALSDDLLAEYRSGGGPQAQTSNLFEKESLRKLLNGFRGRGKAGPAAQIHDIGKRIGAEGITDTDEAIDRMKEIAGKVMEGKSVNAAFNQVGRERTRKFDIVAQYDTDIMRRSGPPSEYQGVEQGLDLLDGGAGGKYQMRGVQWGKSVTDGERAHHLKSCVDSFSDLTGILGLPPQMASFNGKLAMAIGARGKGNALAHYEPTKNVINLTRAGGAGSLAHEWGHFFDYTIQRITPGPGGKHRGLDGGAFEGTRGGGRGGRQGDVSTTTHQAMDDLRTSGAFAEFSQRVSGIAYGRFGEKAAEYWTSDREKFARCFERHVQNKLRGAGRENTYLTAVSKEAGSDSGLWPTDDEVAGMAPHFDAIFEAFRNSDLLHKALAWMGYVREDYLHLMKGAPRFTIPRGR
jgi:hypothetical protein